MNSAAERSDGGRFTETQFWNQHWSALQLPAEVRRTRDHSHNRILDEFDRFMPTGAGLRAIEVGGAPGQYLAYLMRKYQFEGSILDYSPAGCAAARRNFQLLGMPANVHQGDLFEDHPELGQFDVVYSLGLIEHFDDVPAVIERHVRLAKPGGLLVVGCPNLVGLNGWFLERVAPDILAKHNQAMMHLSTWDLFERKLGLSRLSRRCVGGLAPAVFDRWEKPSVRSAALRAVAKALKLGSRWTWASYLDSPWWSHYLIAAYRVP